MEYRGRTYTNKYYIQLFKHCATSQANMYTHGTQAVVLESFRRYAIYSSQFHKLINLQSKPGVQICSLYNIELPPGRRMRSLKVYICRLRTGLLLLGFFLSKFSVIILCLLCTNLFAFKDKY